MLSPFHANLFAHELILRRAVSNVENLIPTHMGAKVDLNPHQINAALFGAMIYYTSIPYTSCVGIQEKDTEKLVFLCYCRKK